MKLKKSYLAMLMASTMGMAVNASVAHAEDLSISGDIGVASQYVWRGVAQSIDSSGGNRPAVQGDLGVSYGGLSASGWFSNSYPSPDPQTPNKSVVEFDWTLDYSGSFGDTGLGYSVGGIYYTYLYDAHSNFAETYVGLSYDAMISPSLTVYYTAKGVQSGFYKTGDLWVDLGLSTSVKGFDLSLTGSYVNWKTDAINRAVVAGLDTYKNGLSLVQVGISKDIEAGAVTITPSIGVSLPVIGKSSDGERYIYGTAAKNEFVAAVNIAY
ncbi:hypothetical protein D8Y20_01180 [Mariprofundus sp. EBB-1]|uniref:TorF family putative porin n=1 Tax=Mariprofundus sp. EBB-1 TaxID=2650971 RepID=UPI000EF18DAB|nr:TorF family putative porin [Mariprofundus sp. EBB-1]RLL55547.1 hypothetical protein D8Y20_01180 [Mariprofundus sp. EBB-1]